MNWMKSLLSLLVSLFLVLANQANACGYYESESDYQAMIFSAKLPQMDFYRPFQYTMAATFAGELNSDPNETDRYRNCQEWRFACLNNPDLNDIYQLLYQTESDVFINFIRKKANNVLLSKNSFVQYLLKKTNREMLDYVVFAKMAEKMQFPVDVRFESWDNAYQDERTNTNTSASSKRELETLAKQRIESVRSPFVKKRYAFQLCRLAYELRSTPNAASLYDKYFGRINPYDLMSVWACLYKAHDLTGDEATKAYLQVFMNCNEKKFRCVQLFGDRPIPAGLTNTERSVYNQICALTNPGKALDLLKNVFAYNPANDGLPFLVEREVNKLEDWLVTPIFYSNYGYGNDSPFKNALVNPWLEKYKKENPSLYASEDSVAQAKKKIHSTDMNYLVDLKGFIKQVFLGSTGSERDFYALSLAHLAILQEEKGEAQAYLDQVSDKSLPTLQFQKNVQQLWLAMKTEDVASDSFKEMFAKTMNKVYATEIGGVDRYKTLFGLTLSLANQYLEDRDFVFGNLLRLRANNFRNNIFSPNGNISEDDYNSYFNSNKFVYFWNNASINDINTLIDLSNKRYKTAFEKFACEKTLLDANWYLDLKGTIAFRDNDLRTAYEAFSKLPESFWTTNQYFTNCLNENPYDVKGLKPDSLRRFDYKFNKTTFLKSLIDLQNKAKHNPKEASDCYNKLGSAFFNTSYWGNSWMMCSYSWSVNDLFFSATSKLPSWMQDYMMASRAQKYFELALKTATNNEQKAYANLMLHYINRLSASYRGSESDKLNAVAFGKAFKSLAFTQTYRTYDCPGIENFLR
jgi:hypothetical protein